MKIIEKVHNQYLEVQCKIYDLDSKKHPVVNYSLATESICNRQNLKPLITVLDEEKQSIPVEQQQELLNCIGDENLLRYAESNDVKFIFNFRSVKSLISVNDRHDIIESLIMQPYSVDKQSVPILNNFFSPTDTVQNVKVNLNSAECMKYFANGFSVVKQALQCMSYIKTLDTVPTSINNNIFTPLNYKLFSFHLCNDFYKDHMDNRIMNDERIFIKYKVIALKIYLFVYDIYKQFCKMSKSSSSLMLQLQYCLCYMQLGLLNETDRTKLNLNLQQTVTHKWHLLFIYAIKYHLGNIFSHFFKHKLSLK